MVNIYPEAELIEGCKHGKRLYQQALYQQYSPKMYGVCLRYASDADEAQDMLQDGFIKVFTQLQSFRGTGSFEGWIRRILVNTCIEHYRKRTRYQMVDVTHADGMEADIDVMAHLGQEEIVKLISSMPEGFRTVFNLYAVEGFGHKEIAKMLGISEGTSKSQFSRAKALLRKKLGHLEASEVKGC